MTATTDVSVIICAYSDERWELLLAAIASVRAQRAPAREIVVVIDHNDALLERLRSAAPDVVALANGQERGLSGARNSGVAVARGAVLAFLDDDATAAPDWLERLSAPYADARVLGVGGAITPVWRPARPVWFPDEFNWVVGCTYRGLPTTAAPVRNLIGCNMSFRREVFAAVGGFRTGIGRVGAQPFGCEETELCVRATARWPDRQFLYEPAAIVDHHLPPGRGQWRYFRARCYAEGRSKALVARHVGAGAALAAERAYTTRTLPRGVGRALVAAARERQPTALLRAGAIGAGLAFTTAGYLRERARLALAANAPATAPAPRITLAEEARS